MVRLVLLLVLILVLPGRAWAQDLVADLSEHLVAITTGFAGADVLLFGAVDEPGDVVVVVRGPARPETVRRKQRAAGIWVNTGEAEMLGAPAFYRVAASRPLGDIVLPAVRQRHEIGIDVLQVSIVGGDSAPAAEFRAALIRLMQGKGLYGREVLPVTFLGQRLFHTRVHFPANVPVGTYSVEVYLLRDGEVVSAQTTPLIISKVGLGAEVYDFAQRRAVLYGIVAVLVAVVAGWLAATILKRA